MPMSLSRMMLHDRYIIDCQIFYRRSDHYFPFSPKPPVKLVSSLRCTLATSSTMLSDGSSCPSPTRRTSKDSRNLPPSRSSRNSPTSGPRSRSATRSSPRSRRRPGSLPRSGASRRRFPVRNVRFSSLTTMCSGVSLWRQ